MIKRRHHKMVLPLFGVCLSLLLLTACRHDPIPPATQTTEGTEAHTQQPADTGDESPTSKSETEALTAPETRPDTDPGTTPVEPTPEKTDIIMWYDIDHSPQVNDRPQKGWFFLNPQHPNTVTENGNFRTTTPLLGLYNQRLPETARQHLYWMRALGCDVVTVDLTNYVSYSRADNSFYKYATGVYKNCEVFLQEALTATDFDAPSVYFTVRLQGTDHEGLRAVLNDVYALYESYGEAFYRLQDGTAKASKPLVVIFADHAVLGEIHAGKMIFEDERFNIRWSNGYLNTMSQQEADGLYALSEDTPFWFFAENSRDESLGEGDYNVFYKKGASGRVEQMIAWASVHLGGLSWDPMNRVVNGKTTFERTLRMVDELRPQTLLINRFNYAMAWLEQPQEGLSLYESTHIEPNKDFGFLIFDNVKENLYRLNDLPMTAPGKPTVVSRDGDTITIDLADFPTEYRVSATEDLSEAEWVYLNINDGIEAPIGSFIQTRNTFGESEIVQLAS